MDLVQHLRLADSYLSYVDKNKKNLIFKWILDHLDEPEAVLPYSPAKIAEDKDLSLYNIDRGTVGKAVQALIMDGVLTRDTAGLRIDRRLLITARFDEINLTEKPSTLDKE